MEDAIHIMIQALRIDPAPGLGWRSKSTDYEIFSCKESFVFEHKILFRADFLSVISDLSLYEPG